MDAQRNPNIKDDLTDILGTVNGLDEAVFRLERAIFGPVPGNSCAAEVGPDYILGDLTSLRVRTADILRRVNLLEGTVCSGKPSPTTLR